MTDKSAITTHILDLGGGRPAAGVAVSVSNFPAHCSYDSAVLE